MAENKKYYWLKLKEGFFKEKEIKKLRKIAGGDTYTIIYLKLMLLSLRDEGRLYYDGIEDTFYEELALEIDEDPENVKITLIYLQRMGLMEERGNTEAFLTRIPESVGSETSKAELMRKNRARKKALESGNNVTNALPPVTNCYTEIDTEKDIDIELDKEKESVSDSPNPTPTAPINTQSVKKVEKPTKHKHGDYQHVLLSDEDMQKLNKEYGADMTAKAIVFLDEYIEMKGYKAKNHYLAIRKWVIEAVRERERKGIQIGHPKPKMGNFDTDDFFEAALENSRKKTELDENLQERMKALKERLAQ